MRQLRRDIAHVSLPFSFSNCAASVDGKCWPYNDNIKWRLTILERENTELSLVIVDDFLNDC